MPFLQDNTDLNGSLGHIGIWRRALAPPEARFALPRVSYGCIYRGRIARVKVRLLDSEKKLKLTEVEVRPGMYGLVREALREEARVTLQNLMWNNEPVTVVLPAKDLQGGDKKYVDENTWNLALKPSTPKAAAKDPGRVSVALRPEQSLLHNTVRVFLELIHATLPSWAPDEWVTMLGEEGEEISNITDKVINGVKRAGMFNTLNHKGFTMQDLLDNADVIVRDCTDDNTVDAKYGAPLRPVSKVSDKEHIIYFWYYTESIEDQKDGDEESGDGNGGVRTTLYVGKAMSARKRVSNYSTPLDTAHSKLRNRVDFGTMRELFVFKDANEYHALQGVVEQLFVSLLETYRPPLYAIAAKLASVASMPDVDKNSTAIDCEHCLYFTGIAEAAMRKTGFEGGVRTNPSFGVDRGFNWSSPMPEYSTSNISVGLWLRQDAFAIDENTGDTFPVANFTQAQTRTARYRARQKTDSWTVLAYLNQHSIPMSLNVGVPIRIEDIAKIDTAKYLGEGTEFRVTIEARMDWKAHPYAFSRLPELGPYNDHHRARSFAINYKWKDNAGIWRIRWHQTGVTFRPVAEVPKGTIGARQNYKDGIEIAHYLFGDPRKTNVAWNIGKVRLIHARRFEVSPLDWTVKVLPVQDGETGPIEVPNGNLKDIKQRKEELTEACTRLRLSSEEKYGKSMVNYRRTRCDLCMSVNATWTCIKDAGKSVCTNCEWLGRDFCHYTADFKPFVQNSWTTLIKDNDILAMERREVLLDTRPFYPEEDPDLDTESSFEIHHVILRDSGPTD